MYKTYLFDLDGTVFTGNEPISAAIAYLQRLADTNVPYYFITNNSTKTPDSVVEKLRGMGVAVDVSQVVTSAIATAGYVAVNYPNAKVFAIGEQGLFEALKQANVCVVDNGDADLVVAGLDSGFDYKKLAIAQQAILNGAVFIGTNGDVKLPHEHGFLPGAGAILAAIATASGAEPFVIGKPMRPILEYVFERFDLDKVSTVLVGDNYDTDILGGIQFGIDTIFVETGVHKQEYVFSFEQRPTYILTSLDDADSL
ncbi:TIGR01457 family HAD-type hydrolase [Culicoidibacter larvae]|uniref:TIGR01457 family HAD-type hydrolase n=1 Tax=Culicoidibacter larvae TaxID=2579976 RepID=A0A5R8QCU4_9FIRM|nr:TIGR01457 family HAD-type hydrolase [Culicoidibacter larvae]TLG74345.1 TIGR01457 family HAD-type hydrolase [Culicoidibacter larvae]